MSEIEQNITGRNTKAVVRKVANPNEIIDPPSLSEIILDDLREKALALD